MNSNLERHHHWRMLIEEQVASGLSRRAFCQKNNLVVWQFTYYYKKLKEKIAKEALHKPVVVPIQILKEPVLSITEIKVTSPNGWQLALPCSDVENLKQWLRVLKSC